MQRAVGGMAARQENEARAPERHRSQPGSFSEPCLLTLGRPAVWGAVGVILCRGVGLSRAM